MKSRKVQTLAPNLTPVTVDEVKEYLRIDSADEDVLLESLIKAATARLENYLDIKLMQQEWAIYFDSFGMRRNPRYDNYDSWETGYIPDLFSCMNYLELTLGNINQILEFNTYDDDNVGYLFDPSNYNVDKFTVPARIMLKRDSVWPATVLRTLNGIEIKVEVGYITTDEVPDEIKQAMKLYVAQLYESRGDDSMEENRFSIPKAALALIDHLKLYRV